MQEKVRSVLLAGLAAVALSGCVTANVTRYRTLEPKASVEEVEVFTERQPERDFEEVGLIEVDGNFDSTYAELIEKAREEGAKLGADAIIVSRDPVEGPARVRGTTVGKTTLASARKTDIPRLWVVAVVWKD